MVEDNISSDGSYCGSNIRKSGYISFSSIQKYQPLAMPSLLLLALVLRVLGEESHHFPASSENAKTRSCTHTNLMRIAESSSL